MCVCVCVCAQVSANVCVRACAQVSVQMCVSGWVGGCANVHDTDATSTRCSKGSDILDGVERPLTAELFIPLLIQGKVVIFTGRRYISSTTNTACLSHRVRALTQEVIRDQVVSRPNCSRDSRFSIRSKMTGLRAANPF